VIRGIIFDCYGVLVHGSLSYLRSITSVTNRQAFDDLAHASDRGYISQDKYIQQVSELTNKTPDEIREIIHTQEIKSSDMIKLVASLKSRYKCAMLSNIGRGAIERSFTTDELKDLFDIVALSSEIGMAKPDGEAYQYVAIQLGVVPEECVMIDDIAVNVQGAELVGMQGIIFKDVEQCRKALATLMEQSNA